MNMNNNGNNSNNGNATPPTPNKKPGRTQTYTPGTIVTERSLYRFSSSSSSNSNKNESESKYKSNNIISSPYAMEERQYYAVASDHQSLNPLGGKSIIFRGPPKPTSEKPNGAYTQIGPALYAIEGLKGEEDPDGLEDFSCYAMALYCMAHPDVIQGRGVEVGR